MYEYVVYKTVFLFGIATESVIRIFAGKSVVLKNLQ